MALHDCLKPLTLISAAVMLLFTARTVCGAPAVVVDAAVSSSSSSLTNQSSASNIPTTVGLGADLSSVQPIVMQSSNFMFYVELRSWPAPNNTYSNCMAGVRYAKKGQGNIMWSFTEEPVQGSSCKLQLHNDGNLCLQHDGNAIAWQSNTSRSGVYILNLTDVGNLVLEGVTGQILWESFNQPELFILPSAMQFHKNQTIFKRQIITETESHFSSPGRYSLRLSETGSRLLLVCAIANDTIFVYSSVAAAPGVKEAEYIMLGDTGIDFYDGTGVLLGTVTGSMVPQPGSFKSGVFDLKDQDGATFILNYWNGAQFVEYYRQPTSNGNYSCELPWFCGEFSLCNPATVTCFCPPGFQADERDCKPKDHTHSLVPISVFFHPQLSP